MDSGQKSNKVKNTATSKAVANGMGAGLSLSAVPALQLKDPANTPSVIQRYTEALLEAEKVNIEATTGSGANMLEVNKAAQVALAADKDSDNKNLKPYFTSMGFEVEFAQQPQPDHRVPDNDLNKAHVIVSTAPGYALYDNLNFIIETDAGLALEFVTAPLLAPIAEDSDDIVPIPAWEKAARKALEFSLRDLSSKGTKTLNTIVGNINTAFGLELVVPGKYQAINYGDIDKGGPTTLTIPS